MTNNQVVWAFINGRHGHSLNMSTDGVRLWSYSTVVAQRTKDGVIFNATKYSRTTSKQVSGLKGNCDFNTKKPVPFNTQDLTAYL